MAALDRTLDRHGLRPRDDEGMLMISTSLSTTRFDLPFTLRPELPDTYAMHVKHHYLRSPTVFGTIDLPAWGARGRKIDPKPGPDLPSSFSPPL